MNSHDYCDITAQLIATKLKYLIIWGVKNGILQECDSKDIIEFSYRSR